MMDARDQAIAQAAAADDSDTAAIAIPVRDPVEDADASFTRKRPRLDSGNDSVRALSQDTDASDTTAASPRDQHEVEMTIRPHPPSSPVPAAPPDGHHANGFSEDPQEISPILIATTEDDLGSPPVVIIDNDDEPAAAYPIQMSADGHFRQFPCLTVGNYAQAVREIAQYIHGSQPLDGQLLPFLASWLLGVPEPSVDMHGFYISKAVFWDDMGTLVNKLLTRRYNWLAALKDGLGDDVHRFPFGEQFPDDDKIDDIFYNFFSAYMRLCSLIITADVQILSRQRPDDISLLPLLSQKHIRNLLNILRSEKAPVFQVLHKEYGVDVRSSIQRLHVDFLRHRGAQNLSKLADAVYHHVPPNVQDAYAMYASQLFLVLGWTVSELPSVHTNIDRSEFHRSLLSFFDKFGSDLQDPSNLNDSGVARDLIQHYSLLVQMLCQRDNVIAAELVDRLLGHGEPDSPAMSSPVSLSASISRINYREDPACYPVLVSNAWKFRILRKYIVKGNMNLRVMSIATMDAALVDIWREFNNVGPSCSHPVMQYLADFLLQGRVAEYIVGVESHPQLISRSGNIVGFLVVTHRWSDDQADAIWRTVSSSPDSRVVAATMTVFQSIANLMKPSDHLYLCSKLYELPIERYTMDILQFLRNLTERLNKSIEPVDYDERGETARPWNVCIRLLRDTAPSREADKNLMDLQTEAIEQFRLLASSIPPYERDAIYRESAQQIAGRSPQATGNFKVICILVACGASFFEQNQPLLRSVFEEIPGFVRKEADHDPYPFRTHALHYRIDLLRLSLSCQGMNIPSDLYQDLWDHLIGERAWSTEARDLAWTLFLQGYQRTPGNEFCKQLTSSYIPTMAPQLYTSAFFEFVHKYDFPIMRKKIKTDQGDTTLLQIPGADLLWPIMLSAPTGTIEDRAARLLATRYMTPVDRKDILPSEVEDAHVDLAKKCMDELRLAIKTLSRNSQETKSAESTSLDNDSKVQRRSEVRISRILLFQKLLLEFVRQKPEFNRGQRIDSKVEEVETAVPFGDAITIKYQFGNDRQSVTMDPEHTVNDLYRRLCHATGYTKLNLFAKGHRLKVFEGSTPKLSEYDFGGQVIVQKADGAELTRPLPGLMAGSSAFETAIVKHFDELFAWMESDDATSYHIFGFLSFFPPRPAFADGVSRDEISSVDLFPPGKVYQARYAAIALQARLREQIHQSAMNETYLSNAVHRLDKALLDIHLIDESLSDPQELHLAAVLASVLLEFLRERPHPDISAGYFSDSAALVDRLVKLVLAMLDAPNFAGAAQDVYATILEASLHSRVVWTAFTCHPDSQRMHQSLLLGQAFQSIRQHVGRKIASMCGGDLPSTCPVTKAETASHFWSIISAILPKTVEYSAQSQQFFETAEHVFRANDEYDRNEKYLRSLLSQWGTILLEHEHTETPGREETDYLVLGLTKLLLCCILSIKSFKKPVNAGALMAQVFEKYLFVISDQAEGRSANANHLPILESHTRQELYDLMLGLAEDRATYDTLLQLAGEIETEQALTVLTWTLVDRSTEIRSSTGYVGLFNPRALCYMNSLLTQLFMNMNFRQFMLSAEVREARGAQRLLFETQRLFSQMQNLYHRAADPRPFAACVKDAEKYPIDITIQMDADEFYNLLFDQLEAQLLKRDQKQRFRSFYGGQTLNQIKSKECEHVSERAEPFFAVQCDVKGNINLQESLQAYVQGDAMEGDNKYKCEACGGKFVDAVKRTCLKDVPDNLIFHLKRFEFDLSDLSRKKIYDHFAFPETLDISPYTADHLADPSKPCKPDWFDLAGVLVHTGTCENGHYYSYIRERPTSTGNTAPTWIEFNDSDVTQFNPGEIADRAFGGFTEDGYSGLPKQYSAYMLFYQRRTAVEEDQRHWTTTNSDRTCKIEVPPFFQDETDAKNAQLLREYSLFDPVHARFLRQLQGTARTINHGTCSEDHEQETRAMHIALAHLGHIAWRQYNSDIFLDLLPQVRRSMSTCSVCCTIALRWLAADKHAITNMIIKCPHPKIRHQVRTLLIEGLKYLREQEPASYGMEGSESDMELDSPTHADGVLDALAQRLRTTADESWENPRGWEDYYLLLTQVAEMGHLETAVLLNHEFLHFVLKLFCLHAYPQFQKDIPELSRIMDKKHGIFNRLIAFLWTLLSHMDLRLPIINDTDWHDRQTSFNRERMKFPLTRFEKNVLTYWSSDLKAIAILDKVLEAFDGKGTHFYPGDIVKWMLGTSEDSLQMDLCRTIVEGVQLDPSLCDVYIQVALPFCEACPKVANVKKVIDMIVIAIASPSRAVDDRLPGGVAVLRFFNGLLQAENERFFASRHPHAFHHCLMEKSPEFGEVLLCHREDIVRKDTCTFFHQLYDNEEAIPLETVEAKYSTARELLTSLILKFTYEKQVGRNRALLIPLVDTCRMLAHQLYLLSQNPAPEARPFQHVNDAALIRQFQHEVEGHMRIWPIDEGTPLSQGEAYDQSDYGSESDDGHDMLALDN
ncbi:hypothetical protein CC86DRAFT_335799 [Ophiobolus disseminans]|uniref:USP domain-containing protein n=1 Tax=Ophiobolus disseminans TaxID=1469910 RepID=A0A6A6ZEC9_9PLEO|nr:hypothetical protein CC86DRAFT_335799 [Ophiobolus disseminans]